MKKALVLAGGGTRGIYQLGVLKALHELGEDDFNMVFGVSVGALNAAMIAQGDIDRMAYMYDHLEASQIVKGFVPNDMSIGNLINERQEFIPQFKYWAANGGIDISPFYHMVHDFYDPEKLFASPVDFFCVTATAKNHDGVLVTKEMMKEHGEDWLVASASAYPAFPVKTIDGNEYVDGGYYDNFPIDYALQQGADEIIGIDLGPDPIHPLYLEKDHIHYIHPRQEMYNFLTFDHAA
jgi:NTE family protein